MIADVTGLELREQKNEGNTTNVDISSSGRRSPICLSPLSTDLMTPGSPSSPRGRVAFSSGDSVTFTSDELDEMFTDQSDHVMNVHSKWLVRFLAGFSLSLSLPKHSCIPFSDTSYKVCIEKLGYTLRCCEPFRIICTSEENPYCKSF